jgi:hypothetical protein
LPATYRQIPTIPGYPHLFVYDANGKLLYDGSKSNQ